MSHCAKMPSCACEECRVRYYNSPAFLAGSGSGGCGPPEPGQTHFHHISDPPKHQIHHQQQQYVPAWQQYIQSGGHYPNGPHYPNPQQQNVPSAPPGGLYPNLAHNQPPYTTAHHPHGGPPPNTAYVPGSSSAVYIPGGPAYQGANHSPSGYGSGYAVGSALGAGVGVVTGAVVGTTVGVIGAGVDGVVGVTGAAVNGVAGVLGAIGRGITGNTNSRPRY